jgi:hypothetical protein
VLLDSGDLLWPGDEALVRYSGGILSFGFGKGVECVLQLLLKRRAGHRRRLSLEEVMIMIERIRERSPDQSVPPARPFWVPHPVQNVSKYSKQVG